MKGEIALLVNPTSGRGRGGELVGPVAERLQHAGVVVRLVVGADADEALAMAHKAMSDGVDALVALGGDGMVHLALQALAGAQTPLGIIPAGTGNDLATSLGLPQTWQEATDLVIRGETRPMDAVLADDGTWWACVLGSGFDSAVTERANRMRFPKGKRKYDLAIVAELGLFRPVPFTLTLDGKPQELEAMFVTVGNADRYGAGMRITPDAVTDDGLLDVTVVGPMSRLELIRIFPSVYKGEHTRHPQVSQFRATSVGLASPGQLAYADGERLGPLPVLSTCQPGAIRLLS